MQKRHLEAALLTLMLTACSGGEVPTPTAMPTVGSTPGRIENRVPTNETLVQTPDVASVFTPMAALEVPVMVTATETITPSVTPGAVETVTSRATVTETVAMTPTAVITSAVAQENVAALVTPEQAINSAPIVEETETLFCDGQIPLGKFAIQEHERGSIIWLGTNDNPDVHNRVLIKRGAGRGDQITEGTYLLTPPDSAQDTRYRWDLNGEPDVVVTETPPQGLYVPSKGGLLWLWNTVPGMREELGWAVTPERSVFNDQGRYDVPAYIEFCETEGGEDVIMFRGSDARKVDRLNNDGTFRTTILEQ